MRRGNRGFSFLEVSIAVVIMATISAGSVMGYKRCVTSFERNKARTDITVISDALATYVNKRHAFPKDTNKDGITDEEEICAQLSTWGLLKKDKESDLRVDPWGQPYTIVIERDYGARYGETIKDSYDRPYNNDAFGFQVYSKGPDGARSTYAMDGTNEDNVGNFEVITTL